MKYLEKSKTIKSLKQTFILEIKLNYILASIFKGFRVNLCRNKR